MVQSTSYLWCKAAWKTPPHWLWACTLVEQSIGPSQNFGTSTYLLRFLEPPLSLTSMIVCVAIQQEWVLQLLALPLVPNQSPSSEDKWSQVNCLGVVLFLFVRLGYTDFQETENKCGLLHSCCGMCTQTIFSTFWQLRSNNTSLHSFRIIKCNTSAYKIVAVQPCNIYQFVFLESYFNLLCVLSGKSTQYSFELLEQVPIMQKLPNMVYLYSSVLCCS